MKMYDLGRKMRGIEVSRKKNEKYYPTVSLPEMEGLKGKTIGNMVTLQISGEIKEILKDEDKKISYLIEMRKYGVAAKKPATFREAEEAFTKED